MTEAYAVATQDSLVNARRITERIRVCASNAREALDKLPRLIDEAKELCADEVLGYPSWTAYLADVFGTEPLRLPRDRRQEIVAYLSGEGMSTRAIAPIVGVGVGTIHRDLSTVPNGTVDERPAVNVSENPSGSTHITGEGVVIAQSRRIDLDTGEVLTGEIVEPDYRPPRPITGLNGKTYTRPAPTPPMPAHIAEMLEADRREERRERDIANARRDTLHSISSALGTMGGGDRYARIILNGFYPHESKLVEPEEFITRARIDLAIEFLNELRKGVSR